eukprot:CAMPEP_0117029800 /NCGR_PEP_ID=MMETSP0472-20121206/21540_1 /TAXON_ID=693140 ORGANISM="Tiarina fusus, Strain LIS" /NCGR_SAMPLE_ID=MMETSP0472 /ASSEMBLY_ACC=CAM_ASM_000603 /LENGTH=431 /DNA_ID=CAMNT_0004737651 /DNA_START=233 /DNA_END=1528 /DNA_ORIENTATION=+
MYFCVIADPESSDMAYTMQVSLPNKIWQQLGKVMGKQQMDILSAIVERSLVLVYLAVVLGCWTIVFWFIYPWISTSTHVADVHKIVGYVIFAACFGSWRLCSTSTPGIITVKSFKHFDHYPYDNLLFLPNKRCDTTNLLRIPRSKFDRLKYDQNVPRYDHFCGWVYNTIGEQNYRWFLLFLAIHVVMCFYGSTVCMFLFYGEIVDKKLLEIKFFDRSTGQKIKSNWFITFQYLFSRRTYEFAVLAVMFVMGIALAGFLGYHLYLTTTNQTTNEAGKWSDIQKWYKSQAKKHKEAVKKGIVKEGTRYGQSAVPAVSDGDVTCTGATSGSQQHQQQHSPDQSQNQQQSEAELQAQQEYFDPGPMPKNMYDRGFVENWKEVIFPMSLRKDALELAGFSRPYTAKAAAEARAKKAAAAPTTSQKPNETSGKAKST